VAGPWLQTLELVPQPDLLISSPDRTLTEIAPILNQIVGVDLDSAVDVRRLKAVISSGEDQGSGGLRVVIGSQPDTVFEALGRFSIVEVGPGIATAPHRNPAAIVGLHGFSDRSSESDTSFSMQMIDDWGIDDVMASALDLASRQGRELAVMFDLAVLDPAFDQDRTTPGGLDLRRLFRAARACGRRPDVSAAGFVKAASEVNLVHAVLSFCAGLAGR
jgi:hypothetical protein